MRNRLTGRLSLLILSFAVALLVFPAVAFAETIAPDGTTSTSMPTIQSDKADYAPGETVTLTGSNWQPGESVHINVNDTYGASWARNVDVTANANGEITDSFNLPDWFVSDYDVTATGAQSGMATTTFTDSQPTQVRVANPISATVTQGNSASYGDVTVDLGGGGGNCTVTLVAGTQGTDTGLPAGASPVFGTGSFTGGSGSSFTSTVSVNTSSTTLTGTYTFRVAAL